MGIILISFLFFAAMVSVGAGLLILLWPMWRGQRTRRQWDIPTAICCLTSGSLFVLAKVTFSSIPEGYDSMAQAFTLATVAFLAGGGSIGFGLTAVAGALLMIVARMSRRR